MKHVSLAVVALAGCFALATGFTTSVAPLLRTSPPPAISRASRAAAPCRTSGSPLVLSMSSTKEGKGAEAKEKADKLNKEHDAKRLAHLEELLIEDLQTAVKEYENPVFTTALIAGDDVILHAIHKAGLIDKIKVIFIDTYHLFPETLDFLAAVEKHYNFKAVMYKPKDCETYDEFVNKYSDDLFVDNVEEYDRVAKVEPLLRALKESNTKLWVNGRRRDQGFERASLQVWEGDKMNPITYWTFEDCWKYIRAHNVPYHPLHDDGYPSLGDMHSTLRVDKDKWFQYGMERAGRFQNMQNSDGSAKTECGIHTVKEED
mmetsp:Transcript_26697/g.65793  ORF Transcript_26697/g.65793 Transcript_26697/m.65793 type:complete len:317 (-) Transcript_26697:49-999(-)|eukprot:CAMPEP_0206226910 /NCGR_PEP_ID=MMETSP0047_2-20121206/8342_1 /ASSEMBLY_ACC=CAM_ASM_000192 /TAXON_ID=195065 /ORGANISM="Chroomonas mesostigmatica_cf, Strain CCMP1168" /LENGTH=316 /DNA_ID=CAMNT_0053650027 /DNA_START=48 /DNA_END=998 /DNA_ORIENTATION=+